MADKFLKLMVRPSVLGEQQPYFGHAMDVRGEHPTDALTVYGVQCIRIKTQN